MRHKADGKCSFSLRGRSKNSFAFLTAFQGVVRKPSAGQAKYILGVLIPDHVGHFWPEPE
jgi:hypothetical protein